MKKFLKPGFTLIELLVVIAIIGILAGVIVVSLSGSKGKAEKANAQSTLTSVQQAAVSCVLGGDELGKTTTAGSPVCVKLGTAETTPVASTSETAKYVDLPTDWAYGTPISSPTTSTFSITADDASSSERITCDQNGCKTGAIPTP